MMSKKLCGGLTALLVLLLALWLLVVRPLTDEQRLMERLKDRVADGGEYQIDGTRASWSIFSPFSLTLDEVTLGARKVPDARVELESLKLNLLPSAFWSFDPSSGVTSLEFRGARLHRAFLPESRQSESGFDQGLDGELRIIEAPVPGWKLEFTGRDLRAQKVLAYLGARFKMRSSVDVIGEFTARGQDLQAVRRSLKGTISLRGGPGELDASGIDSLNRGPVRWARDSGHFVDWPDVFDFQRLDARFDVLSGLDETRFSLEFENMTLEGSGAMDFFTSEMDYGFELQFLTRGGQDIFRAGEHVADTPWPIRCVGSFEHALPCRLDQHALTELALKLIEEDAKDALSRLFGEESP